MSVISSSAPKSQPLYRPRAATGSSSSSAASLESTNTDVRAESRKPETVDEDDKYPCLRRALSCTETPVLPLGTYAVEFGFDVATLPFGRLAAAQPQQQQRLPLLEYSNPSDLLALPGALQQQLPLFSPTTSSSNNPLQKRQQQQCSSCEQTDCAKPQCHQGVQLHKRDIKCGGSVEEPKLKAGTPLEETTAEDTGHDRRCKNRFYSGESNSVGIYAKIWKKDNRTWLWKSSSRNSDVNDDKLDAECPLVAKRWKKDNRSWLWKSSAKS